ncbi:TetR/AcrR family transcriptional regulator [Saccharopolyspora sp. NPDC047091]|uniref:TetR/AcrR family transcriptional regulator n=1 Tax=Saccharopolyspora sp. NPDC047091 TaxID=3155924 RepID=UPI0033D86590
MPRTTTPDATGEAPSPAPEGLRERKKRATRQALQQAAVRLFREHGAISVTVEDICAAAEVSPRTFFNYFAAKEEVLVPWDPQTIASTPQRVVDRPGAEPLLRVVRAVLGEVIDTAMAAPTWRDQALVLRDHPELVSRVALASRDLELALADGLSRRVGDEQGEAYVRLLAATGVTALRVAIQCWQRADPDSDLHDHLDAGFARLARGFAPD